MPAILEFYNSEEGKQAFDEYCKIKQNLQDDNKNCDDGMDCESKVGNAIRKNERIKMKM